MPGEPPAQPFSTILIDELDTIADLREARGVPRGVRDPEAAPATQAHSAKLFGLALSGGGIRSATFSLGILQVLAQKKLLKYIDYLSTVSGGGYIGSWLTAWLNREPLEKVVESLDPDPPPGAHPDGHPITWLRQYSNYLTPHLGLFNADTWSMAAIWSRNTLLNLLILISGSIALLLLPRIAGMFIRELEEIGPRPWIYGICVLVPLVLSTTLIGLNIRPRELRRPLWYAKQSWVQWLIVFPVLLAGITLSAWLAVDAEMFAGGGFLERIWIPSIALFILFSVIQLSSNFRACFARLHPDLPAGFALLWALQFLIAAVSAFVCACLLRFLADIFELWADHRAWAALTFGPPLVLVVFSLGVVLQIGLMGRDIPDAAREWMGRLRAWMMIYSLAWLAACGASIYAPLAIAVVGGWWGKTGIGIGVGWVATTLSGIFAAKSDKSRGPAMGSNQPPSSSVMDLVATIGPYVFMAGFFVGISFGVHQLVTHRLPPCVLSITPVEPPPDCKICAEKSADGTTVKLSVDTGQKPPSNQFLADLRRNYWPRMNNQVVLFPRAEFKNCIWAISRLALLFGVCAFACALLAWRVDINEFSLHQFYRNRLIRCYLGASRAGRNPNPFTGFDGDDNIKLARLLQPLGGTYAGPYPILNATLNLSVGRNLAWQERRGTSFIFTPGYTGFDTGADPKPLNVGWHQLTGSNRCSRVDEFNSIDPNEPGLETFGYQRTENFSADDGLGLGTAVGISGAAANPNHGYHTSTAVAFLMTVFDVRLGWWLSNPRRPATLKYSSPTVGFFYLLKELLGLTDARTNYVNLSDGGHFDNMGLYELIRRRCRYIVICDGEQDQYLAFHGLAGAIRKCRIDFGVEIDIKLSKIRKTEPGKFSTFHCAAGRIYYPEDPQNPGYLVHLKSSLTGDEPVDVLEYHDREPLFPHQSTGDQWFDESQFESYRRLGLHVGEKAFGSLQTGDLETLFGEMAHAWNA